MSVLTAIFKRMIKCLGPPTETAKEESEAEEEAENWEFIYCDCSFNEDKHSNGVLNSEMYKQTNC